MDSRNVAGPCPDFHMHPSEAKALADHYAFMSKSLSLYSLTLIYTFMVFPYTPSHSLFRVDPSVYVAAITAATVVSPAVSGAVTLSLLANPIRYLYSC